ncbi:LysR family transcriptional regulator [Salmonella enterica]|uniref:LysR family transcriptional regulator n=1 Tax=Salmonella enterica TaxID=28901 RepID=A0A628V7S1_SALER|nr:LysR family transcriptional regulator [Salmonella enterica]EEC6702112.1 LysR family transcriptional regulator [Salmonella enterica]ELF5201579.1 LysR family transcriptional regulator [Salmonella enterica]
MQNMQQYLTSDTSGLPELVTFIALADTLSFQLAAGHLRRDATVISRRLQALEKRLGVRLIERNTRSVALTEAGEVYAAQIRDVLRLLAEANSSISQFGEGVPRGNLRISLPEGFGRLWIAPLISEFMQSHPLISIEAEYDNRYVDLISERFDIAVRLGELNDSRLVARRIVKWFTEFGLLNRGDMLTSEHYRCLNEKKKFQRRV